MQSYSYTFPNIIVNPRTFTEQYRVRLLYMLVTGFEYIDFICKPMNGLTAINSTRIWPKWIPNKGICKAIDEYGWPI